MADAAAGDANRAQLSQLLDEAEQQLAAGPFLAGAEYSAADVLFTPLLFRLGMAGKTGACGCGRALRCCCRQQLLAERVHALSAPHACRRASQAASHTVDAARSAPACVTQPLRTRCLPWCCDALCARPAGEYLKPRPRVSDYYNRMQSRPSFERVFGPARSKLTAARLLLPALVKAAFANATGWY